VRHACHAETGEKFKKDVLRSTKNYTLLPNIIIIEQTKGKRGRSTR